MAKKKKVTKVEVHRLTDKGKELVSVTEYTPDQLKKKSPLEDIGTKVNTAFGWTEKLKINSGLQEISQSIKKITQLTESLTTATKIYKQNPTLHSLTQLQERIKEVEKSKKAVKGNYWYELKEEELQEAERKNKIKEKENEALRKQIEALRKQIEALKKVDKKKKEALDTAKETIFNITNENTILKRKKKQPPVKKRLSLNPNFDDFNSQIKVLHESTEPLFDATIDQWQNLFSEDMQVFKKPIKLKRDTTLATLREVIDMLGYRNVISKKGALTTIANAKAFMYDNRVVTFNQLNDTSKTINDKYHIKHSIIEDIEKALKLI